MTPNVSKINEVVNRLGGRLYYVGGTVRDQLLGRKPKDVDLLVGGGLTSEALEQGLATIPGAKVDAVGKSFGVIKVTLPGEKRRCPQNEPGCGCQDDPDETIDVALPRKERSTGTGHGDFEVTTENVTVEEDLGRRDFTMNAIAIDVETGATIDPFNGLQDIEDCIIRAVGDAEERFAEDPLRMLRALRFSSRLGFDLSPETGLAVIENTHLLSTVAAERVGEEFSKILIGGRAVGVLNWFHEVLRQVLPEFVPSIGFEQNNKHHHLTVSGHVLAALDYAIKRNASLRARWAVLLHDIAKPACYSVDEQGHGHFYRHEEEGAKVATQILTRLKFSTDFIQGVSKIVREHLRPQTDSTDKTLRRYVAAMGELVEDGLMCREADMAAHAPEHAAGALETFQDFRQRIAGFKELTGGFDERKLALKGDTIAFCFGVKGKSIGELKKAAAAAVVDGLVANEEAALLEWMKALPGWRR